MRAFVKQLGTLAGAGIAATLCLGFSRVVAAVDALGLGLLIHDAYLFPAFVAFVAWSLWLLYRSARAHASLSPFWLGVVGGALGALGLWLFITGLYPLAWPPYAGIMLLGAGSLWDLVIGRRVVPCAREGCNAPDATATRVGATSTPRPEARP